MLRVQEGTQRDIEGYLAFVRGLNPRVSPKRLPDVGEYLTVVHKIGGGVIMSKRQDGKFIKVHVGPRDKVGQAYKVIDQWAAETVH